MTESGKALKRQVRSVDLTAAAWQQVVVVGERKAVSKRRLLRKPPADRIQSGETGTPKSDPAEQRISCSAAFDATFRPCMPVGEQAGTRVKPDRSHVVL